MKKNINKKDCSIIMKSNKLLLFIMLIFFSMVTVNATWYNDTWNNKMLLNVTSDNTYTDQVFSITLNSSNFNYSKSIGTDLRVVNSSDNGLVDYRRFLYNESADSTLYIKSDLTTGTNLFYLYYNASGVADVSNSSLELSSSSVDYTNIVAHWELENLTDSSPNGYDLTNSGAVANSSGYINGSYTFDGATDFVTRATSTALTPGTFSISAWVYVESNLTAQYVLFKDAGGNNNHDFNVFVTSDRQWGLQLQDGTGSYANYTLAPARIGWQHIAFTSDGVDSNKFYLNGTLVDDKTFTWTLAGNTNKWDFGSFNGANSFDGSIDELRLYNKTLNATEISDVYSYTGASADITTSYGAEESNTFPATINSIQLSAMEYLDLTSDGTNYGKTSDGFTAGSSKLYNITTIDDTSTQVLLFSRTELDGALTLYVNGNNVGTSPAYAGGSGDWIYEAFEVSSAFLNAGNNEINISADSGNGATVYVDYIGLADMGNIANNLAENESWVITYANITSTDGVSVVKTLVENSTSDTILSNTDVANEVVGSYNYFYIYQLPSVNDVYTFRIEANSTTVDTLTTSGSTETVEIDSLNPVMNTITLNLNSYVGENETFTLNFTENNKDTIKIEIDGTNYSMNSVSSSGDDYIYDYSFIYSTPNTHNITFYVTDLVGKVSSYSTTVKSSEITQTNQAFNFNTLFNYTNGISVTDTYTSYDQYFKVPVLLNFYGNAYINDYYPNYTILDTNPFNISVELGDTSSLTNFSDYNNSMVWLTDVINNTATNNVSFYNYIRYYVDNAISVEWENSGVGDNRLFYIESSNMSNNISNVTLSIPLRTAYSGNSSSIDVFVCTDTPNWVAKTCNQWTEITSTLFTQNDLTYHAWGSSVSDYPTVDSNSDGTKDTLRFTVPSLTNTTGIMYKIESDNSNSEVSWSGGSDPETPASSSGGGGGGLASTLLSSDTTEEVTNTTAVKSNTNPYISGFWEFVDVVFTWLGDVLGGIFSSLAPLFNGDPKNTILIILIAVMLVGIPLVSGGSAPKKRGVASRS